MKIATWRPKTSWEYLSPGGLESRLWSDCPQDVGGRTLGEHQTQRFRLGTFQASHLGEDGSSVGRAGNILEWEKDVAEEWMMWDSGFPFYSGKCEGRPCFMGVKWINENMFQEPNASFRLEDLEGCYNFEIPANSCMDARCVWFFRHSPTRPASHDPTEAIDLRTPEDNNGLEPSLWLWLSKTSDDPGS